MGFGNAESTIIRVFHMKSKRYLLGSRLIFVGAAMLAACSDEPTNTPRPRSDATAASISFADTASYPSEAEFRAIARAFPGFAGYYYDNQKGELVVQMDAAGRDLRMLDYVRSLLGNRPLDGVRNYRFANVPVAFRIVKYNYADLQRWRLALTSHLLAARGRTSVAVALNPRDNNLFVGLASSTLEAGLRAAASRAGVPNDAFQVSGLEFARSSETVDRVSSTPAASLAPGDSLTTRNRPVHGGVEIRFLRERHGPFEIQACSFGLGVTYNGQAGFLTASHCTNSVGSVASPQTAFFQRDVTGQPQDLIGTETIDPPFFSCEGNQVAVERCRNSDIVFAAWNSGATGAASQGIIARTTFAGAHGNPASVGSLRIDAANPQFLVTSDINGVTQGEPVHKTGKTTGWTSGDVFLPCVNSLVQIQPQTVNPDTIWTALCLPVASYGADGGDSGGAAFKFHAGSNNVEFMGLSTHRVRFCQTCTWYGVYSPYHRIRQDFPGTLVTAASGAPPPPPPPPLTVSITGPTLVRPSVTCGYFANVSGGVGGYSYAWTVNGQTVGSNSSELLYTNTGSNFTVGLVVTDQASASGGATKFVTVSVSAPHCVF